MLSIFTNGKTFVDSTLIFGAQKYIHLLSMTYNKDLKGISFTKGFFMLIGLAVAGLLLGTVISIPVWTAMTGKSALDIATEMKNPAHAPAIRMMQLISVVFGFLIPAFFVAWLLHRKPTQLLGFRQPITAKQLGLVVLLMISALLLAGTLGYLNKAIPIPATWRIVFDNLEKDYALQVGALMGKGTTTDLIAGLFILAFIPALAEETLFRGGLQNFLGRATHKAWLSIIIVSVLFSVVHASFYGFLPRLFLGITLGLIFYYTKSIWLCIVAHFLNNALAIIQLYLLIKSGKSMADAMNEEVPYWWGLVMLPVFMLVVWQLKKHKVRGEEMETPTQTTF
jgi:membrane protease YdiL (CAAX protease family)